MAGEKKRGTILAIDFPQSPFSFIFSPIETHEKKKKRDFAELLKKVYSNTEPPRIVCNEIGPRT
jgi:hypothetical protein